MTILDKHLELIQSQIKNNDLTKACIEFSKLIKSLEQNNDENLPWLYYEYGLVLFDNHLYEDCLDMLNKSYKLNYMRSEIKEFLYSCFVTPNLSEFEEAYNNNLNIYNSKNNTCSIKELNYKDLSLEFIPIGEDRYYVFDTISDSFTGVLDLNNKKNKDQFKIELDDEFSDILIVNDGNLNSFIPIFNLDNDRKIYYISQHAYKALSFFKLPNIVEKLFNNTIIFDSLDRLHNFFRSNTEIYLPHITLSGTSKSEIEFGNKVKAIIEKEHEFRLSPEGRDDRNILLSICIPTWNRGNRALDGVMSLLDCYYDSEIEIIVSDNNSSTHLEQYKKIKNFPDSRIKYYRSDVNTGFIGNFCKVTDLSKGKFCLILSDEDKVNLAELPHYMSILKNNPNLGLIRSGTSKSYINLVDTHVQAGISALQSIFLSTNYMPGIIYNIEIIQKHNLANFIINCKDNLSCSDYPHMWLDSIISLYGDVFKVSNILCIEGECEAEIQLAEENAIKSQAEYSENSNLSSQSIFDSLIVASDLDNLNIAYTYENRLNQHMSWIDLINLLSINDVKLNIWAYVSLCWKTHFLVSLVKDKYIKAGYDWNKIYNEIYICCVDGIDKLNPTFNEDEKCVIMNYLKNFNKEFTI